MKHLLKKISLMGGKGKKPKTQPATLKPPVIGEAMMASSYSYAESLDLISDGPIGGLVNQNGLILTNENILQGIYLNDAAIAVSNDLIVNSKSEFIYEEPDTQRPSLKSAFVNHFIEFFTNLRDANINNFGVPSENKPINNVSFSLSNENLSSSLTNNKTINGTITGFPSFRYFVNNYDLSLSSTVKYPYDLNQKTEKDFFDLILSEISSPIQNMINWYNLNEPNRSSKDIASNGQYLYGIFSSNFGEDWSSADPVNLIRDWAYANLDSSKITYIISNTGAVYTSQSAAFVQPSPYIFPDLYYPKELKFILVDDQGIDLFKDDTNVQVYDFLWPNVYAPTYYQQGVTNTYLHGCIIIQVETETSLLKTNKTEILQNNAINLIENNIVSYSSPISTLNKLASVSKLAIKEAYKSTEGYYTDPSFFPTKYNYSNILAEYRAGEEFQNPLKYFRNILIDKDYQASLIGPFVTSSVLSQIGDVQRIVPGATMLTKIPVDFNIFPKAVGSVDTPYTLRSLNESSNDTRRGESFSNWNKTQLMAYDESASPIKHIINNPNVSSILISLQINSLFDTTNIDVASVRIASSTAQTFQAGSKYPAIVNVEIEIGLISENGVETLYNKRKFRIVALIESPTIVDIGGGERASYVDIEDTYRFVKEYNEGRADSFKDPFTPFLLPSVENSISALDSPSRRYVKITKLSTETNSVLINKDISLYKVTEIIPLDFNYPHSAIVATKIDSRSFGTMPTKTFDCKLKKVKVPSNYNPSFKNGKDKRYYPSIANFDATDLSRKKIYNGDWDGTFKPQLEWTDNPAWILYDIIINERYGLGQYIDPNNDIDVFDLYKIGRFCDAVDDNGYFVGVPDNAGGLEPRFSCNIMFSDGMKVFDALNTISALFRGLIYYNNSQINFVDDRPKTPIALFANTNVKDGIFNYTNYRRDEQFNSIEIVYIDRFDNFLTKVEYVEDEDDIRKRGIFKKTINANGVTSRAMARRLGKHLIFQTIKENQSVSFTAGLESLLCKPGDLIIIEDELKSLKSNFGRVLSVNPSSGSIRLSESFLDGQFDNKLTVYTPTGYSTNQELLEIAQSFRTRLSDGQFILTTGSGNRYVNHTGIYKFSDYTSGFNKEETEIDQSLRSQYAFYTGDNYKFCYFSTQFTGWVLATGIPFTNNDLYNKFIFNTGDHDFTSINRGSGFIYSGANESGRSTIFQASIATTGISSTFRDISGLELGMTKGILDSEISLSTAPQITTFSLSGITDYEYGSEAFVDSEDINYSLVPFVKEGSAYRFQRKNADDQIYKVISIKEESVNEYSLICTKFNTGKYALIEGDKSIVNAANTFSYTLNQKIGDKTYQTLSAPSIQNLTTGQNSLGFYISGNWKSVANAQGYNVYLYQPNGATTEIILNGKDNTGVEFYAEGIGNYSYRVGAYGNYIQGSTDSTLYYDSDYNASGLFLVYNGADLTFDRPYLSNVTIL